METNFNRSVKLVLRSEAGFVDDPKDPGGATNLGITIAVLKKWRGHAVSKEDVRKLTIAEASKIYHANYWLLAWGDRLPVGIDYIVFDIAVNSGITPALNMLRERLGLPLHMRDRHKVYHEDERHIAEIGRHVLLDRVAGACMPALICGICRRREEFYRSLGTFDHFGKGWLSRNRAVEKEALRMWATAGMSPTV
jgi:lysozyme family protein